MFFQGFIQIWSHEGQNVFEIEITFAEIELHFHPFFSNYDTSGTYQNFK